MLLHSIFVGLAAPTERVRAVAHEVALDEEAGLIHIRYSGTVDLEDFWGAIEDVLPMLREPPPRRTLSDFCDVESWLLTTADLRGIGRENFQEGQLIYVERAAIVAVRDDIYGDLRAWVSITDKLPFPRRVFRGMDEAERWIETGLDV